MYIPLSSEEIQDLHKEYSKDRLFQNLYSAIGAVCAQTGDITPEEIWKLADEYAKQIVQTDNDLFEIDALPNKLHFLLSQYKIGDKIIPRTDDDISRTIFFVELVILYQLMRSQKKMKNHPYQKYCMAILSHIQNHPLMEKIIPVIKTTNDRYEIIYGGELEPHDYLKDMIVIEKKHNPVQELTKEPDQTLGIADIDQHLRLFKAAMLKVQTLKSEVKYKHMIENTYDWVAAERLGKDIGLLKNYDELLTIMKGGKFVKVPKNSQNLSKYRSCIDTNTQFPNWQCSDPKRDGLFRRFKDTANTIYSIYKLGCQKEHIKPYGSQ